MSKEKRDHWMKPRNKELISFYIPAWMKAEIKDIADELGITYTALYTFAIGSYLQERRRMMLPPGCPLVNSTVVQKHVEELYDELHEQENKDEHTHEK